MNIIEEYNKKYAFFAEITGLAMKVHCKYGSELLESAYEAALKYLLIQNGHTVEQQVFLPMYWENVKLDQNYRMDLVIDSEIILELKAISFVETKHRRQLKSYMNLTHKPYGMIINFGAKSLYSEWYRHDEETGDICRVKLM